MQQIITVGNISDGKTQSRTVYMADGLCPTLCSGMDHGNTIPYVIEIKGVDKVNEVNTIAKSRAEQSRAEQSRGLAIFMVWMAAIMLEIFTIRTAWLQRYLVCKEEGGSLT